MENVSTKQKKRSMVNGRTHTGTRKIVFKLLRTFGMFISLGNTNIKPYDVAIMMSLFKIARVKGQKHHEDNFIDCAGYVGIACDLKDRYEAKKMRENTFIGYVFGCSHGCPPEVIPREDKKPQLQKD